MKEKAFRFGKSESLIGIISDPVVAHRNGPAIIILNSGLLPRVGPNRLHVKIARELASVGFVVLRFDLSGIGDSKVRSDNLPFEKSSKKETQEAMDFLTSVRGVQEFILMGICSGADIAFQVACVDSRVVGIAPIDFYTARSIRYSLYTIGRRALNYWSWRSVIMGRRDVRSILRKIAGSTHMLRVANASSQADEGSRMPTREKLISGFHSLMQRGVHICLIYSVGPAYYNYRLLFKDAIRSSRSNELLQTTHLSSADHGFITVCTHSQIVLVNVS